ncbi:MAG TPA: PHP domain-containing protein, partial [Burkholderiales bacterium]
MVIRRARTRRFMGPFPVEFFDMAAPQFVHLRLHSEYSVSDGVVRIDDAVERARTDGMPALALTDAANV